MGKFEVLAYLQMLRATGDGEYYRHCEVHEAMRRSGQSYSFTSVWRSINGLYSDGLLEVRMESRGLQRTAKFRARTILAMQGSQVQRVDNIRGVPAENEPSDARRARQAPQLEVWHG